MLEKLFPYRRYRVNFHAHSTYSDGSCTPQEIDAIAETSRRKNMLIAITDHNTVRAHEEFASPRIPPGAEIKVEEGGVDFLLYLERKRLLDFYYDIVEPTLDPRDPIFGATRLRMIPFLGVAREAGAKIIGAHYSHSEGLAVLPIALQREAAKYLDAMELNALLSQRANAAAKRFARAVQRPLVAAADSHRPDQYCAAYTSIPLRRDEPPTVENLLHMLHEHPWMCRRHLRPAGLWTRLMTGWNVLTSAGIFSILRQYFRSGRP